MSFNLADLYLLIKRGTNLFLERINLSVDEATEYTDGKFSIHLDRRVQFETGGVTTLPYTAPSNIVYVDERGKVITSSDVAGLLANGEVCYAGIPYTFKYEFSEPVVKQNNQPITTADLRIRNWSVVYNDTGFFTVKTTPNRRSTYTRDFTGRIVGGAANLLSKAAIDSGTYQFGVVGNSDTKVVLETDSHLPANFQSAEWEGFYVIRSRRI